MNPYDRRAVRSVWARVMPGRDVFAPGIWPAPPSTGRGGLPPTPPRNPDDNKPPMPPQWQQRPGQGERSEPPNQGEWWQPGQNGWQQPGLNGRVNSPGQGGWQQGQDGRPNSPGQGGWQQGPDGRAVSPGQGGWQQESAGRPVPSGQGGWQQSGQGGGMQFSGQGREPQMGAPQQRQDGSDQDGFRQPPGQSGGLQPGQSTRPTPPEQGGWQQGAGGRPEPPQSGWQQGAGGRSGAPNQSGWQQPGSNGSAMPPRQGNWQGQGGRPTPPNQGGWQRPPVPEEPSAATDLLELAAGYDALARRYRSPGLRQMAAQCRRGEAALRNRCNVHGTYEGTAEANLSTQREREAALRRALETLPPSCAQLAGQLMRESQYRSRQLSRMR